MVVECEVNLSHNDYIGLLVNQSLFYLAKANTLRLNSLFEESSCEE